MFKNKLVNQVEAFTLTVCASALKESVLFYNKAVNVTAWIEWKTICGNRQSWWKKKF